MTTVPGSGFTLIELLIAAAIAGLLIGVVLAVYGSILNTVSVQNRWRERVAPAAGALDIIIRDLACAFIPFGITNQPFTAEFNETPGKSFQMSFYSAFPTCPAPFPSEASPRPSGRSFRLKPELGTRSEASERAKAGQGAHSEASELAGASNDWRGYSVSHVSYSWTAAGTDAFVLVRECNPYHVPSRNLFSSGRERWLGIKKLNIAFFNGSSWTNQWGYGKATNALPQSARISLIAGENDSREIGSEVFINAARQIVPVKSK